MSNKLAGGAVPLAFRAPQAGAGSLSSPPHPCSPLWPLFPLSRSSHCFCVPLSQVPVQFYGLKLPLHSCMKIPHPVYVSTPPCPFPCHCHLQSDPSQALCGDWHLSESSHCPSTPCRRSRGSRVGAPYIRCTSRSIFPMLEKWK